LNPLLRVCSLLNAEGARYLVAGGQAVILHGVVRTTQDVDILIDPTEENCRKVLAALSRNRIDSTFSACARSIKTDERMQDLGALTCATHRNELWV
jgi:hypothetical protein